MRFFRKKPKEEEVSAHRLDPTQTTNPQTAAEYLQRGRAYHAREEYQKAEDDFRQAISLDTHDLESHFALGLTLKVRGRKDEAASSFEHVLKRLEEGAIEEPARATMLKRLTVGHINELQKGDWDLEKEIWRRD